MKKIYLIISIIVILVAGFLFYRMKGNSLKSTLEEAKKVNNYQLVCDMEMSQNDELKSYEVKVEYLKKEKQKYYRVELYDKSLNQAQIIIRNKKGVYVLTPTLNQMFKFQSNWPENSPKPYIYSYLIQLLDDNKVKKIEKGYQIEAKVSYPNDPRIVKQQVIFDKKLKPLIVLCLDKDEGEAYDILIPSDYMIERLKQEKLIQPLDQDKITCMDDINDSIKNLSYDPNNEYSVPYFWGSVGIVYDKTKVSKKDLKEEGFNIFLNQKYKGDIYLYDSERDSFMMALKALGYSMNTDNEKELADAYNWLLQSVQTMSPEIVTDEIIDNMAQARKALGIVYSGDAAYIMSENENIGFYMPKQGTNIWCDAMVIQQSSKNVDLAHEFINYVSSYDAAYDNSSYVGYTSPNTEVMNDLKNNDFKGINAYDPIRKNNKDEVFNYNSETRKTMANYWAKVKIAASNANRN